jgi:excisionase family DNA binding protein
MYMVRYELEPQMERRTLTITETAKALGVSRNKAYEAAKRGEIPTIKIGKRPSQKAVGTAFGCPERANGGRHKRLLLALSGRGSGRSRLN